MVIRHCIDCGKEISVPKFRENTQKRCGECRYIWNSTCEDHVGEKYNMLTVIKLHKKEKNRILWECICECGNRAYSTISKLKSGHTKSCGCYIRSRLLEINTTHGLSRSPEHAVRNMMIQRCTNPKNKSYHNYGGRGISVCDRWKESFENFIKDMGRRPSSKHTLERNDNDKDYCPSNCSWETRKVQSVNTRQNIRIVYNGVEMPMMLVCEKEGLNPKVVRNIIYKKGISPQQSIDYFLWLRALYH